MAATGDKRIESATLFTTQVDFTHAGDLKVFVDEEQIHRSRTACSAHGYLEGSSMATAFNMLRPNDLIWPYVVNIYLKGKSPLPVRPALLELRFHAHAGGQPLLLPAQLLPREQSSQGRDGDRRQTARPEEGEDPDLQSRCPRGPHRAGQIGVHGAQKLRRRGDATCSRAPAISPAWSIRPASRNTSTGPDGKPEGELENWIAHADETPGTWWPHWIKWIEAQAPERVKARKPGGRKLKPLCDAPGEYVKVRA